MQRTIRGGVLWAPRSPAIGGQIATFGTIGVLCTIAYAVLYSTVRQYAEPLPANAVALGVTMGFNFAANRHLTFRAGRRPLCRQFPQYAAVYLVGLAASTVVLGVGLHALDELSRTAETIGALMSGGVATAVRFVGMRQWVFRATSTA